MYQTASLRATVSKGLTLSLAALGLAGVSTASAQTLLSSESFSGYNTGEIQATNPSPTVAGYTGNWTDIDFGDAEPRISSGSLMYGGANYLGSTGDKVSVTSGGGETAQAVSGRVYRLLDSSLAVTDSTTGSLYLSFLFQSGQETGATTYQTLALYNGSTADAGRNFDAGLTTNGGQTGTFYNFGVDNTYTSTGVAADTSVHLFVVKFDLSATAGSDNVTLWIDPTLDGIGDPTGGITATGLNLTWDRLALSDYDGNSAAWDEIRWGTSFDSVTVAASAIPEPSTYAAIAGALALVGVVAVRRRRKIAA